MSALTHTHTHTNTHILGHSLACKMRVYSGAMKQIGKYQFCREISSFNTKLHDNRNGVTCVVKEEEKNEEGRCSALSAKLANNERK